jgi:hypothetical protein
MRDAVLKLWPEFEWIRAPELREQVSKTWAARAGHRHGHRDCGCDSGQCRQAHALSARNASRGITNQIEQVTWAM